MILTNPAWWRAAGMRSIRTALVTAVPYLPATYSGTIPWQTMALAAAFAFVLSMVTALTGLPETTGSNVPWWQAIIYRVVRTTAQAAIAGFGSAVLITDVNWGIVANYALVAGFGSLVLGVIAVLPEETEEDKKLLGKAKADRVLALSYGHSNPTEKNMTENKEPRTDETNTTNVTPGDEPILETVKRSRQNGEVDEVDEEIGTYDGSSMEKTPEDDSYEATRKYGRSGEN